MNSNRAVPRETSATATGRAPNPAFGEDRAGPKTPRGAQWVHLPDLPGVDCPCGVARRGFADCEEFPGTIHLTTIHADARPHFHKRQTEVYTVLDCDADAAIELDGVIEPVKPLTSIMIPPGVVHRAIGRMTVLICCTPKFDSADEYFPDPQASE